MTHIGLVKHGPFLSLLDVPGSSSRGTTSSSSPSGTESSVITVSSVIPVSSVITGSSGITVSSVITGSSVITLSSGITESSVITGSHSDTTSLGIVLKWKMWGHIHNLCYNSQNITSIIHYWCPSNASSPTQPYSTCSFMNVS